MRFLHVRFCSVLVQETELGLTCSVWFGQNGKTLLRSVTIKQVKQTMEKEGSHGSDGKEM